MKLNVPNIMKIFSLHLMSLVPALRCHNVFAPAYLAPWEQVTLSVSPRVVHALLLE